MEGGCFLGVGHCAVSLATAERRALALLPDQETEGQRRPGSAGDEAKTQIWVYLAARATLPASSLFRLTLRTGPALRRGVRSNGCRTGGRRRPRRKRPAWDAELLPPWLRRLSRLLKPEPGQGTLSRRQTRSPLSRPIIRRCREPGFRGYSSGRKTGSLPSDRMGEPPDQCPGDQKTKGKPRSRSERPGPWQG